MSYKILSNKKGGKNARKLINSTATLAMGITLLSTSTFPPIISHGEIIVENIAINEQKNFLNTKSIVESNKENLFNSFYAPEIKQIEINNEELIKNEEIIEEEPIYDENMLYWLARLIQAESGSDYCTDELQLAVGSVVINRLESDKFPNTIEDVIHQTGQYACVNNGSLYNEPSERAIENAKYLLINGTTLSKETIFQAEFIQGDGITTIIPIHIGNYTKYMYFCY